MQPGDKLQVTVDSVAFEGKGVARLNDFVIFIPFVLPQEVVEIEILKVKKNYAEAKPIEILKQSPQRIKPPCPHFGQCGGCVYQHLSYDDELTLKGNQVRDVFEKIGGIDLPDRNQIMGSPLEYHYRSKIRMKFKRSDRFGHKMGFFDYYDNRLLDVPECRIAAQPLNDFLTGVRRQDFEFFRQYERHSCNLSMVLNGNGEVMHNLAKEGKLTIQIKEKKFVYDQDCFFQVNHFILPRVIDWMQDYILSTADSRVKFLDLYCGVGFFGIMLGDFFEEVWFLEENRKSAGYLKDNLKLNLMEQKSRSWIGAAHSMIDNVASLKESVGTIMLDPPRSGSDPHTILKVCELHPARIFYLSCNPATQSRDAKLFREYGYEISANQGFDFFPRSKHVEHLIVLEKPKI